MHLSYYLQTYFGERDYSSKCKEHDHDWCHQAVIENFVIVFNNHLIFRWFNFVEKESGTSSFQLLDDDSENCYEIKTVSKQRDRLIILLVNKYRVF